MLSNVEEAKMAQKCLSSSLSMIKGLAKILNDKYVLRHDETLQFHWVIQYLYNLCWFKKNQKNSYVYFVLVLPYFPNVAETQY